jgi:hypothetical protein
MPFNGRVEFRSPAFLSGWAAMRDNVPVSVCALLRGEVIGFARAAQSRPDLVESANNGGPAGGMFIVMFDREVAAADMPEVTVRVVESGAEIGDAAVMKVDREPVCQVFIFGSPRSGTSELGKTLAKTLALPWLGEGHAAPLFAKAAEALQGNAASANKLVRYMAHQNFRKYAVDRARLAYYALHGSASFLDKTPGWPTIAAAPFLYEAFPAAKFIYLQRNGISNVLSRMAKFDGNFGAHCADWVKAVECWEDVRAKLPHYLEVMQEDMLDKPQEIAGKLAAYLGVPDKAQAIGASLAVGVTERTGAGLGRLTLEDTGWTAEQKAVFVKLCGKTMDRIGATAVQ